MANANRVKVITLVLITLLLCGFTGKVVTYMTITEVTKHPGFPPIFCAHAENDRYQYDSCGYWPWKVGDNVRVTGIVQDDVFIGDASMVLVRLTRLPAVFTGWR